MEGHDVSEWCVSLAFVVFSNIRRYISSGLSLANLVDRFGV